MALFAGAGGGILGTRLLGFRVVCAAELDPYCREILLRRQEEGHLEPFPLWDNARTFEGRPWRGVVDVVTAGFPCQPFSVAGQQEGKDDERNLWPETLRYAAAWRATKALGYQSLITYTLASEGGASLRAAGWKVVGGDSWRILVRPVKAEGGQASTWSQSGMGC